VKILFLTENFPPEVNAIASRVYERARYWARDGHEVTVITCFPNFPQGRIYPGYRQRLWQWETLDGIRVLRLPTYMARNEGVIRRSLDFLSFMLVSLCAIPWVRRPDIVVATSPQFFAAVAGWLGGVIRRRPFVLEIADLWPASIAAVGALKNGPLLRSLEVLELFLYRRASAIVTLTDAFRRNLLERAVPAGKVAVVINGVDLERFAPRVRDAELAQSLGVRDSFVVGYVGTHGLAHQLDNVINAAALLMDAPALRFLFVGDGADKERIRTLAATRGLDNVKFIDPMPKDAMPRVWSVCDVALVHLKNDPVFAEVIPSKIFEAMAMGLPILLVAPRGEASRIVVANQAGQWVPAAQPELLASAVRAFQMQPEVLAQVGARNAATASRYSRRKQADDMLRVLERVVAGEGGDVGCAETRERMRAP
jgi:glycosyltransferase involved in cell wall biosynthesis